MKIFQSVGAIVQMLAVGASLSGIGYASEIIEILELDVLAYEDFAKGDPATLQRLKQALYEKGIVGIRSVPGYKESASRFIEKAREFSSLSTEIKHSYAPKRDEGEITGYEIGKEKFRRPDGTWISDDAKASYYAFIPQISVNKWPLECSLEKPFQDIGLLMFEMGKSVVKATELMQPGSSVLEDLAGLGRMLHYSKQSDATIENPYWCGAHFDHGLFTVLLPAYYFIDGKPTVEPAEAGLFVRTKGDKFYKVVSDDPDVMLFQVGEFGQLVTDDAIRATEHRVHKALGGIERYTMALFIFPPMDTIINSFSELANDARYNGGLGAACSYREWNDASLSRYLVKDKEEVSN